MSWFKTWKQPLHIHLLPSDICLWDAPEGCCPSTWSPACPWSHPLAFPSVKGLHGQGKWMELDTAGVGKAAACTHMCCPPGSRSPTQQTGGMGIVLPISMSLSPSCSLSFAGAGARAGSRDASQCIPPLPSITHIWLLPRNKAPGITELFTRQLPPSIPSQQPQLQTMWSKAQGDMVVPHVTVTRKGSGPGCQKTSCPCDDIWLCSRAGRGRKEGRRLGKSILGPTGAKAPLLKQGGDSPGHGSPKMLPQPALSLSLCGSCCRGHLSSAPCSVELLLPLLHVYGLSCMGDACRWGEYLPSCAPPSAEGAIMFPPLTPILAPTWASQSRN